MEYNSDAARIYIENQIVPQGFQANQFINFLKTKKTNGMYFFLLIFFKAMILVCGIWMN